MVVIESDIDVVNIFVKGTFHKAIHLSDCPKCSFHPCPYSPEAFECTKLNVAPLREELPSNALVHRERLPPKANNR